MALPLPNLDDRNFDQLLQEMTQLLPRHNGDWTNRNPSDPGIMLLELFAYLIEMDIFQLNRVTNETYARFLKLVGVDMDLSVPPTSGQIKNGIQAALKNMSYFRAISENDIYQIVYEMLEPLGIIPRVYCFPDRNFYRFSEEPAVADWKREGHLLIVIVVDTKPFLQTGENICTLQNIIDRSLQRYTLGDDLFKALKSRLDSRRILTSHIHIFQPMFVPLGLTIRVFPEKGVDPAVLIEQIRKNILEFYCPVWGGEQEKGFGLGRTFKVSESIEVIENTNGVDYTSFFQASILKSPFEMITQFLEPKYYEQIWIEKIEIEVLPIIED